MKNHLKLTFGSLLMLIALWALTSCVSTDMSTLNEIGQSNGINNVKQTIDNFISEEDATNAATSFLFQDSVKTRSSENAIVHKIHLSSDESTFLYIVNFDEGGFVILTNSKDLPPVLAYSEESTFDVAKTDETGIPIWMEDAERYLKRDYSEEDIRANRLLWNCILNQSDDTLTSSQQTSRSYSLIDDLTNQAQNQWIAKGWNFYNAKNEYDNLVHSSLPYQIKEILRRIGENNEPFYLSGRPLIEDTYIVETVTIDKAAFISPKIKTKWGQGIPYNKYLLSTYNPYYPGTPYLGCTTIALGQILKYRSDLVGYDFSKMPDVANETNCGEVSRFLYDVGKTIGMDYESGDSGASDTQVRNAIRKFGYRSYILNGVTLDDIYASEYPVFVAGYAKNFGGEGHAWVCDGHCIDKYSYKYVIMIPNENWEDLAGSNPFIPYLDESNGYQYQQITSKLVYCNWGFDGLFDGYYKTFATDEFDFNRKLQIITIE